MKIAILPFLAAGLVLALAFESRAVETDATIESRLSSAKRKYDTRIGGLVKQATRELDNLEVKLRRIPSQETLDLLADIGSRKQNLVSNSDFPPYTSERILSQVMLARAAYRVVLLSSRDEYLNDQSGQFDERAKELIELIDKFESDVSGLYERMFSTPPVEKIGDWKIVGNELIGAAKRDKAAELYFGATDWKDIVFSVEYKCEIPSPIRMVTRRLNKERWAFDIGTFGGENHLDLLPFSDGVNAYHDVARRWMPNRVRNDVGQWHSLRVKHSGDTVTVSFDQEEVCQSKNPLIKIGRVGLYLHKGSQATFRNIEVTSANGAILWRGMKAW
ncbi:MAG: DUF1080 domain-containing protein [Planctomycetales bacterium]|nr:DUF1080 domain-containing protein [Planctomycetales bacterium]